MNANVQMNDIVEHQVLNNDQNNRNLISNDHADHCNHVKMYQYVFHRNNLNSINDYRYKVFPFSNLPSIGLNEEEHTMILDFN